jgi:dTDP-glucose pyrophosphorylase
MCPSLSRTARDAVCAAPHVRSRALVVLGDLFLDGRLHEPFPTPPAVGIWPEAHPTTVRQNFGVRLDGDGRVVGLIEKPSDPDGLVCGIGVYLLAREQIESFAGSPIHPSTGEREITAAMEHLRSRGAAIGTIPFAGSYINVNSVSDRELAGGTSGQENDDQRGATTIRAAS